MSFNPTTGNGFPISSHRLEINVFLPNQLRQLLIELAFRADPQVLRDEMEQLTARHDSQLHSDRPRMAPEQQLDILKQLGGSASVNEYFHHCCFLVE